jgi:hypothetical protein
VTLLQPFDIVDDRRGSRLNVVVIAVDRPVLPNFIVLEAYTNPSYSAHGRDSLADVA